MGNDIFDDNTCYSAILNAVALLLLDTDYNRITVKAIIEEVNVSRSTFYRHFNSADEAIEALEDKFLAIMGDINRIGLITKLRKDDIGLTPSIAMRLEVLQDNSLATLALLGPHAHPRFKEKEKEVMGSYFKIKIKEARLSDVETDLYLSYVVEGHNSLVYRWLSAYPDLSANTVAEFLNQLFYSSISARLPR